MVFQNGVPHVFLTKSLDRDVCINDVLLDHHLAIFTEPIIQEGAGNGYGLDVAAGGISGEVEDDQESMADR